MACADRALAGELRFTIYKVLQGFQREGRTLPRDRTPANVGLFLRAMGTLAMVMGTTEYLQSRKSLQPFQEVPLARPSFLMALVMSFVGVLLFFDIIARVL